MFDWLWGRKKKPDRKRNEDPAPTPELEAPVIVRGSLWKNTSATDDEIQQRVEPNPPPVGAGVQIAKIKEWIKNLGSSVERYRLEAMRELNMAGAAAVPALLDVLAEDPASRAPIKCKLAVQTLGTIGPAASGAAGALARTLSDSDPSIRCAAAESLGNLGPAAVTAMAALVVMVKNENEVEAARGAAVRSLAKLDPLGSLDVLVAATDESGCYKGSARWNDPDTLFEIATRALIQAGPEILPTLEQGLKNGAWAEGSRRRVDIVVKAIRKPQ